MLRIATESPITRIESFLRKRGERGAAWGELALEFLCPAQAGRAVLEKVLRGVLADATRFREVAPGRWTLVDAPPPAAPGGFTVIETLSLPLGGGREVVLEAGAERLDAAGAGLGGASWAVKPLWPVPPGAWPDHLRGQSRQAVSWTQAVSAAAAMAEGTTLVSWRQGAFGAAVQRLLVERGCVAPELGLRRLARALLGLEAARSREALAGALGLVALDVATAQDAVRATTEALAAFLRRPGATAAGLLEAQRRPRQEVDFAGRTFSREDVDGLAETPGTYLLRDSAGEVVYVGKAANLRRRVSDYFRSRAEPEAKTEAILAAAWRLETRQAGSELEALLMESRLLRELRPRINVQFAARERGSSIRARDKRVIVLLPSARPACAEVFLAWGNEALEQVRYSRRWAGRMDERIKGFFFGSTPPAQGREEARLFWTWMARRRDEARVVDAALAASPEDAARLAREQAEDILAGQPRAFRV